MQLAGLKQLMTRYEWPEYREYVEKLSGKEGNRRPKLDQLMQDARDGKIDTVMVWKMDRFGRSTLDTLSNIRLLAEAKVRFLCPSMNIDTDERSPISKFMIGIFALIAELERDFILERTQGGYKAYRADYEKGKVGIVRHSKSGKDLPVGRPHRFRPEHAKKLRDLGLSWRAIGNQLGVRESAVRQALKKLARKST